MSVSIISLNVRGLSDVLKRRIVFNYYKTRADIICIQESHSHPIMEDIWRSEFGGDIYYSHGTTSSKGVCILVKKGTEFHVVKKFSDNDGRVIACEFQSIDNPEIGFSIINIYAPNKDQPSFFVNLLNYITEMSSQTIIVGDFNLVMDCDLDRKGSNYNHYQSKEILDDIVEELSLVDIWRARHQEEKCYTWMRVNSRGEMQASRLDYALVSQSLASCTENVMYLPGIKTDHLAFFMAIDLVHHDRGKGYWKFNNSLLNDKDYVQSMNQKLEDTFSVTNKMELNDIDTWLYVKKEIRTHSQKFAKSKVAVRDLVISQLSEKIIEMEYKLSNNVGNVNNTQMYNILMDSKSEIEELLEEKNRGVIFRTKARFYEYGEKNSKYFFALEKSRYNARTCKKLLVENKLIEDPVQILNQQEAYYKELYQRDHEVNFLLENRYDISVPPNIKSLHEKDFTIEELTMAVKCMKRNKSPGICGLTSDFFQMFWSKLKTVLYNAIVEMFKLKEVPKEIKKGIINLIPKAQKNARKLANLRPITLLCTEIKIIEKMLANRLEVALEYIIHSNQKGFMKNRQITSNIRMIFDLMQFAEQKQIDAIVLSLDFMKCFDKIEHNAIIGSLQYFGFAQYVIDWVKILYTKFTAVIQNNGHFTNTIPIEKGVHQGGCASTMLFLICAEVLALELRGDSTIKGIPVNDIVNLLGQFADDMDMYMLFDQQSLQKALDKLDTFKKHSGFTISYDKTQVYRIGSIKNTNAMLYTQQNVRWTNQPVNILGIKIAGNADEALKLNYEGIITKTKSILKKWNSRNLSIIGKVLVINTLIASLFVYKMQVLPCIPDGIVKQIEKEFEKFLWKNGRPKITLRMLQQSKTEGGLGLVDLKKKDSSVKCMWPDKLEKDTDLANIVYSNIAPDLKDKIWQCHLQKQEIKHIIDRGKSPFWYDVLYTWSELNWDNNKYSNVIWYNSHIKVGGIPIFWEDVYKKGLFTVNQLYENSLLMSCRRASEMYGLDLMRYNSLISAIPIEIKTLAKTGGKDDSLNKIAAGKAYKILLASNNEEYALRQKVRKWETELEMVIPYKTFVKCFEDIWKVTNVSKFRSFQYRLLQRAIITNVHLFHWGMVSSNLCSFCNLAKETYCHLFIQCPKVQAIWLEIEVFMNKFTKDNINFGLDTVICNRIIGDKPQHVKNFVCLVVKQYIYRQRCLERELSVHELKCYIKKIRNIECYIATKNNKMSVHEKKWYGNINRPQNTEMYVNEYIDNMEDLTHM